MNDLLGVLFCMLGFAAAVAAWRVFLERDKPPRLNRPPKQLEGRRGVTGALWDVVFFIFLQDYGREKPDTSIGWMSAVVALAFLSTVFFIGGVYVGWH